MLILTRRPGENLRIGNDISIIILNSRGNQVRIGIDAPKIIPIYREEIYQYIQRKKYAG